MSYSVGEASSQGEAKLLIEQNRWEYNKLGP
jgi:hypothetical protein